MPKNSGESMRVVRTPARPQPSRAILHGFAGPAGPVGPKTEASAMGAAKRADALRPSTQKSSGRGKMNPQMVF